MNFGIGGTNRVPQPRDNRPQSGSWQDRPRSGRALFPAAWFEMMDHRRDPVAGAGVKFAAPVGTALPELQPAGLSKALISRHLYCLGPALGKLQAPLPQAVESQGGSLSHLVSATLRGHAARREPGLGVTVLFDSVDETFRATG